MFLEIVRKNLKKSVPIWMCTEFRKVFKFQKQFSFLHLNFLIFLWKIIFVRMSKCIWSCFYLSSIEKQIIKYFYDSLFQSLLLRYIFEYVKTR